VLDVAAEDLFRLQGFDQVTEAIRAAGEPLLGAFQAHHVSSGVAVGSIDCMSFVKRAARSFSKLAAHGPDPRDLTRGGRRLSGISCRGRTTTISALADLAAAFIALVSLGPVDFGSRLRLRD
jgi:hypothetical protein